MEEQGKHVEPKQEFLHAENQRYNKGLNPLTFYCFLICFYLIHSVLQAISGYQFHTDIGWFYICFNICAAIGGLYGYEQHKNEVWVQKLSSFILPLSILGLPCGFYPYPVCCTAVYIAFSGKSSDGLKWFINSLCLIPLLLVPLPIGVYSLEETYSPSGKYVVVSDISDLGATGGSVFVSAGRYLDLGILGRYLPNKTLFSGGYGEIPECIEFIESETMVIIDGKSYIITQ